MSNTDFPLVITAAGPQPTPPATLNAALIALATSAAPGLTANLPASMIEDIASTATYALALIDSARVETVNSLTTFGANAFTLSQLGQLFIGPGAAPAPPTNTSVFVQFSVVDGSDNPVPGYVIPVGFTVSDGTYQYIIQDGGVTSSNGTSPVLFCEASIPGTWSIAAGTVSQIISTVPSPYVVTCSNPLPGTPGNPEAETEEQYRARVNQALQAVATGTTTLLKTLLGQVSGVQQRLISTIQQPGGWEVIVGGGDPYQIAGAIFAAGLNITTLIGSVMAIDNITQATLGVVTTVLNHGYTTGQSTTLSQILGMTPLNGQTVTVTVISEKTFSINVNTTGLPAYISGGVSSLNARNVTVNIIDPPNVYGITFVNPPAQTVTMTVTWNTTLPNFASQASVAQSAAPAIANYINSISAGQPMSTLLFDEVFIEATANILPTASISDLSYQVFINGVLTAPVAGSPLIFGDPESFFETDDTGAQVTVAQA